MLPPIRQLFYNSMAQLHMFMVELGKGNLYQGNQLVTYNDPVTQKVITLFVYLEDGTITISDAPMEIDPLEEYDE